jgi:hypothetical protein
MPFGTKEFMKLMNLAIWYYIFPVRFIQFHQVVKEELHRQWGKNSRTNGHILYTPLPLDSGGGVYKYVPYQILLIPEKILERGWFGFFLIWKGINGKKGTFTRYVDFFFNF